MSKNKLDCHVMTDLILTENGDQCALKKQILKADRKASPRKQLSTRAQP